MAHIVQPEGTLAVARMSRRRVLSAGILAAASWCLPRFVDAADTSLDVHERSIAFYNTHTSETLRTIYWAQGEYLPEALQAINHILRDHRVDSVKAIDCRLLDLLSVIRAKLESRQPFHIISGYRTPHTNAVLRARGHGVAKKSLHTQGQAIDIRLPGTDCAVVRRVARSLKAGGVGYYQRSNFVHLDTGPVRSW
jgi:uncharacterized protein YcbK (DUF882 family)